MRVVVIFFKQPQGWGSNILRLDDVLDLKDNGMTLVVDFKGRPNHGPSGQRRISVPDISYYQVIS